MKNTKFEIIASGLCIASVVVCSIMFRLYIWVANSASRMVGVHVDMSVRASAMTDRALLEQFKKSKKASDERAQGRLEQDRKSHAGEIESVSKRYDLKIRTIREENEKRVRLLKMNLEIAEDRVQILEKSREEQAYIIKRNLERVRSETRIAQSGGYEIRTGPAQV